MRGYILSNRYNVTLTNSRIMEIHVCMRDRERELSFPGIEISAEFLDKNTRGFDWNRLGGGNSWIRGEKLLKKYLRLLIVLQQQHKQYYYTSSTIQTQVACFPFSLLFRSFFTRCVSVLLWVGGSIYFWIKQYSITQRCSRIL